MIAQRSVHRKRSPGLFARSNNLSGVRKTARISDQ